MIPKLCGAKVRELRERLELTPTQFAVRIGRTQAWQLDIEVGRRESTPADLTRIALEFRVSPADLVEIEPETERPRTPAPDADAGQVVLMSAASVTTIVDIFKAHEARRLVRVLKKLDGRQGPLLP